MQYREFLDENMHRQYPLADDANGVSMTGHQLPPSFLADMRLLDRSGVPGGLFLSEVAVSGTQILVTVSKTVSGRPVVVSKSEPFSVDLTYDADTEDREVPLGSISEQYPVSGKLVIGTCKDMKEHPGTMQFTSVSGRLLGTCVMTYNESSLKGIQVNGQLLTGTIEIIEGDNVTFKVTQTADGYRLTVNAKDLSDDGIVPSSEALLDILNTEYGRPITTINGNAPTDMGDFTLSGIDLTTVTTSPGALTINNTGNTPCANKSYLDAAYTRIGDLNKNYSRLQQLFTSIQSTITMLIARLSAFSESKS